VVYKDSIEIEYGLAFDHEFAYIHEFATTNRSLWTTCDASMNHTDDNHAGNSSVMSHESRRRRIDDAPRTSNLGVVPGK